MTNLDEEEHCTTISLLQ